MKLGISSAGFYGRLETEQAAAYLTRFDVDACEIFLETHSEYTPAFGEEVRKRLAGLMCVSVHPKGTQFEPDIFGQSQRQVTDGLRSFEGVCRSGQALGARYYVFHGPNSPVRPIELEGIHHLKENVTLLIETAAKYGIELLWENVSWCALRTPAEVRRVRELFPDMGFVLDTKQAFRAGVDPLDMLDAMGERVRHIHALDWDARGRLTLPGQGIMDWDALFRRLRNIRYAGAVILEPYPWQTKDEEEVRRCLRFLRAYMD